MLGDGNAREISVERMKAALIIQWDTASSQRRPDARPCSFTRATMKRPGDVSLRPYDKATIWEQFNLMRLAKELKADVFLWECMGLTPSYVKILQRKWGRDDVSTITNNIPTMRTFRVRQE